MILHDSGGDKESLRRRKYVGWIDFRFISTLCDASKMMPENLCMLVAASKQVFVRVVIASGHEIMRKYIENLRNIIGIRLNGWRYF
jgi:hypothetical protein